MSSIKNFLDKFLECAGVRKGINREPDKRVLLMHDNEFDLYVDESSVESLFNIVERLVSIMEVNNLYKNTNVNVKMVKKNIANLKTYLLRFEKPKKLPLDHEIKAVGIEPEVGFQLNINPKPSFYRGFTERVNNILNILGDDEFALSSLYRETNKRINSVINPEEYKEVTSYSASVDFENLLTEMFVFGETLKNRLNILCVGLRSAYVEQGGAECVLDRRVERMRASIEREKDNIAAVDIMSYVLIITDFLKRFDDKLDQHIEEKDYRIATAYMFFINQVLIDSLESEYVANFSRVLSIESENKFYLIYALMPIVMYYCLLNQRFNDLTEKTGGK
jgi:hypothetical protein